MAAEEADAILLAELNCGSLPHQIALRAGGGRAFLEDYAAFANGLFANGLFANGLFANGLALQASGAMTPAAADVLRDPAVRPLFSYIVSCALPPTQALKVTVDGQALTFPGAR